MAVNRDVNPLKSGGKGSLGSFDVIGNKLDEVNPYLDMSSEDKRKLLDEIAKRTGERDPLVLEKLALENPQWLSNLEASTIEGVDPMKWTNSDAAMVDNSAFEDISSDPRLREDQMASIGALQELVDGGGMNAQDQANLSRIQSQAAQADRGRREAILQNAAQRGMGGSGMELLAQLDSSQAATDRQAQEGLDVAGMAQDRALQAMMQKGSLAGNIRGQDFGEDAQRASAMDAVSRFNASNKQQNNQFNTSGAYGAQRDTASNTLNTQQYNAGATQSAAQYNNAGRQGIHNTGVANNNQETIANTLDIPQANFNNAEKLQDKKDAADLAVANEDKQLTAEKAKKAEGAMKIVGSFFKSDERAKKEVKDVNKLDMEAFLATISPKSYRYKDGKDGQGDFTGIMAQDLLKSKVGSEVTAQDEEGSLGYDKDKMQGVILAALKHLSDKIDNKKG
jgi:hypothetical protein